MSLAVSKSWSPAVLAIAAVSAFVTAAVLCLAIWNADGLPSSWANALAIAFFLYAAPFLVLTHELGHLGMAVAMGWRVPILALGGWTLRFSPLRFSAGAPPFSDASGAVIAVPPENGGSRAAWIAVHAGGPLADLTVAALAAAAAMRAPPDTVPHVVFLTVAAIAGASVVFNLIPSARRGGATDGMQILADLVSRNAVSRGRRQRLVAEIIDGKRPRDWNADVVRAVERDSIWTGHVDGTLNVYLWHFDRGEMDAARTALRRAADRDGRDDSVLIEQAFAAAVLDKQSADARRFLSRVNHSSAGRDPAYWRANAATALAEGDAAAARLALGKWRHASKDWVYATPFDWDWLDRVTRDVDALARGHAA